MLYPYHTVGQAAPNPETFLASFQKEFLGHFVFGFMDNFFMIWIGDIVEGTLAKQLRKISKSKVQVGQYASGLGNLGSDIIGVSAGDRVGGFLMGERGIANPWGVFWGKNLGIGVGCLVGLFAGVWVAAKTRTITGSAK